MQNDGLIGANASVFIDRMRVAPLNQYVRLGAHDEESRAEREHKQALEIDVSAIHHVECARLRHDLVEDVYVVHLAVGNADKRGDIAVQVQQRVHLDGGFVLAELGPWEQGEAEIDGRRVQGVKAIVQVDAQGIAGIEWPGHVDQDLCEVGEDPPIMGFVRIGQRRARHLAAKAHVV